MTKAKGAINLDEMDKSPRSDFPTKMGSQNPKSLGAAASMPILATAMLVAEAHKSQKGVDCDTNRLCM